MKLITTFFTICLSVFCASLIQAQSDGGKKHEPLVIGETFTIESKILKEKRRINVYLPPAYFGGKAARLPVMYMPDGGIAEDFLHVAGLIQVSTGNETMRPFILIGIENTERRRDLTGETQNEKDKKIAPRVGGSAIFRRFIREELMPEVKIRYRTTPENGIIGESLAGLFVVETFLLEPDLFETYIAFDPSLWWNDQKLLQTANERLPARMKMKKRLYVAQSRDALDAEVSQKFAALMSKFAAGKFGWEYVQMPEETHATIYHPAALRAFRTLFKPSVKTF